MIIVEDVVQKYDILFSSRPRRNGDGRQTIASALRVFLVNLWTVRVLFTQ